MNLLVYNEEDEWYEAPFEIELCLGILNGSTKFNSVTSFRLLSNWQQGSCDNKLQKSDMYLPLFLAINKHKAMAHEIATINDKNVATIKDNVNLFDGSVVNISVLCILFYGIYVQCKHCTVNVRITRCALE